MGNDRPRPRRPRLEPTAEVANLILRRILIFGGIFLGAVFLLFCVVFVVMIVFGAGLTAFVKSGMQPHSPPAATKPATTLKK